MPPASSNLQITVFRNALRRLSVGKSNYATASNNDYSYNDRSKARTVKVSLSYLRYSAKDTNFAINKKSGIAAFLLKSSFSVSF